MGHENSTTSALGNAREMTLLVMKRSTSQSSTIPILMESICHRPRRDGVPIRDDLGISARLGPSRPRCGVVRACRACRAWRCTASRTAWRRSRTRRGCGTSWASISSRSPGLSTGSGCLSRRSGTRCDVRGRRRTCRARVEEFGLWRAFVARLLSAFDEHQWPRRRHGGRKAEADARTRPVSPACMSGTLVRTGCRAAGRVRGGVARVSRPADRPSTRFVASVWRMKLGAREWRPCGPGIVSARFEQPRGRIVPFYDAHAAQVLGLRTPLPRRDVCPTRRRPDTVGMWLG